MVKPKVTRMSITIKPCKIFYLMIKVLFYVRCAPELRVLATPE